MVLPDNDPAPSVRHDGFGARSEMSDPRLGRVERLELTPALSTSVSEQAIRARAAHLTSVAECPVGRVLRIERKGDALSVFSAAPDGVPLAELLAALEFKTITLSDEELLELATSVVTAVATMHERLPGRAHGGLTPAHIILQRDGTTMLTGAVYGDALQALQRNREHLWREFGIALPAAASLPRFDQRGDVTQLGAVVLAIMRRRILRGDEYPRGTSELIASTTVSGSPLVESRLRGWLQDTLLLQGRVVFASAVEAARAFNEILPTAPDSTVEALVLQTIVRQMCGQPPASSEPVKRVAARVIGRTVPSAPEPRVDDVAPEEWPEPHVAAQALDEASGSAERTFTFLRSLLPHLRAS